MVEVDLDPQNDERVVITARYMDLHLVEQVPGVLHDRKRSANGTMVHTAPRTWATWMALQGVFYDRLPTLGPGYTEWLNRDWEERVQPCLNLRSATNVLSDPRTPWDKQLYPFQRAGVAFLSLAGQAILADDLGTGKTVTFINTLRRLDAYGIEVFPVLCVVPNSTKGQWRNEWERWFPGVRVSVVGGSATDRRRALTTEADVYVIHWEAVQLHSRLRGHGDIRLRKCAQCDKKAGDPKLKESRCETHKKELNQIEFRSVVADEAHLMKNPEAKRTRAIWAVMNGKHVRFRYAMTGTPIGDNPGDLWPIVHALVPSEYPTITSYRNRYCLQTWNWSGELIVVGINPNTRTEFFGFFDARFRRMPKELVLPFLPPVVYEARQAPMAPKQATAFKQMKKHLMAELEPGQVLTAPNNLAKNIRLLQFASATCVLEGSEVRMTKPAPKLDIMLEVIQEAGNNSIVVCAESRKLIELASSYLDEKDIPHQLLVGGMTDDMRNAALHDLNSGRIKVLLFTMKAGGVGLNMTRANYMLRLERSWSMLINVQTLGRINRIGSEQHDSITVIDTVVPGTDEEKQFEVLGERMARLEEINRDKVILRQAGRLAEAAALEREEYALVNSWLLP